MKLNHVQADKVLPCSFGSNFDSRALKRAPDVLRRR